MFNVYTETLFGRPPFASKSYGELEEKIRSNQPIEVRFKCYLRFYAEKLLCIQLAEKIWSNNKKDLHLL